MSILSTISSLVTPAMLGQVASMLGTQTNLVEKAMNGAVPGLLGALLGATKTAGGKDAFAKALADQDPSMVDNLGAMLGQDGGSVASSGSKMLTSMLGEGPMGDFTSKLQGVSGLPTGAAGSLTGLAGSLIMGAFAKLSKQNNTDASGMLSILEGEAGDIAKAMPADFAESFRGTGLLSGLEYHMAKATDAATEKVSAISDAAQAAPAAAGAKSAGRPFWQWALLAIVILAILAWLFGLFGTEDIAEVTETEAPSVTVDGTNVGAQLETTMTGLGETLTSVTDAATAQSALPDLNAALETFSGIENTVGNLPQEGQAAISTMVDAALPNLRVLVDGLMNNSAVQPVIGPVVEQIMTALQNLG